MNKNKLTIIVILVLSAIAGYLYFSNNSGTIKKELKDFAVKDTAQVSQLFIADAFGNTAKVARGGDGVWTVNDKYEVRRDAIDLVLSTIHRIDVKSPVSKASFESVIKNMAGASTKVEIYMGGNKPAKVFYVGGPTKDQFGTYMMLENSSVPFITHIPGFFGYLSTRFFTEESAWRSTALYRYKPQELETITIKHENRPEESFELSKLSSGKPILKALASGTVIDAVDTLAVLQYKSLFRNKHFEFYANDLAGHSRDSIMQHCKLFSIEITDTNGNKNLFKAFRKPLPEETEDAEGKPMFFDLDRMYGLTKEGDFVIIQHFVFDELTPRMSFFLKQ
jgi:hypothetical protein